MDCFLLRSDRASENHYVASAECGRRWTPRNDEKTIPSPIPISQ